MDKTYPNPLFDTTTNRMVVDIYDAYHINKQTFERMGLLGGCNNGEKDVVSRLYGEYATKYIWNKPELTWIEYSYFAIIRRIVSSWHHYFYHKEVSIPLVDITAEGIINVLSSRTAGDLCRYIDSTYLIEENPVRGMLTWSAASAYIPLSRFEWWLLPGFYVGSNGKDWQSKRLELEVACTEYISSFVAREYEKVNGDMKPDIVKLIIKKKHSILKFEL